jgi:dihydroneopterin aldolase
LNHNKNLDRIRIRDLSTRCILGINSWEREKMQDIILSITLHADLSAAGRSDNLEDSVDYKALKNRILETRPRNLSRKRVPETYPGKKGGTLPQTPC